MGSEGEPSTMTGHRTARGVTAAIAAAALTLGATPSAGTAQAATTRATAAAGTVVAAAPQTVTVRPDPSYQGQQFEGWGTSLVWFANATGGYPKQVREKLADLVFGEQGLNLN